MAFSFSQTKSAKTMRGAEGEVPILIHNQGKFGTRTDKNIFLHGVDTYSDLALLEVNGLQLPLHWADVGGSSPGLFPHL